MATSNQLRAERRKQPQVLSLHVLAGMEAPVRGEQSQWAILVHHFLDRFFNSEMASSDDEGKTRLIQVACATGLPGWVAAMYLWPVYHDIFKLHRPYWSQVGDHYFFVVYSMVAMGIIVVFEWDLFFPDLLDIFVLSSLPIKRRTLFLARIVTVCIFVVGFLVIANFLVDTCSARCDRSSEYELVSRGSHPGRWRKWDLRRSNNIGSSGLLADRVGSASISENIARTASHLHYGVADDSVFDPGLIRSVAGIPAFRPLICSVLSSILVPGSVSTHSRGVFSVADIRNACASRIQSDSRHDRGSCLLLSARVLAQNA